MAVRIVRLGTPRARGEGIRIGTVRRPPRAVPKDEFASRDFYDTWLPELAPSADLLRQAHSASTERDWEDFRRHYRREMDTPDARHLLDLLATLSQHSELSVGCYCEDETRCHRSVLGELLEQAGARFAR